MFAWRAMANAKLSDCRRKRKVERERHTRIASRRRAERRGGSSSPASCLRPAWALTERVQVPCSRVSMLKERHMKRTSRRQGRGCEAGSEGSPRQNHGAMNKNIIKGLGSGVSRHNTTKPVDSGLRVNDALAGWKSVSLSGETCFTVSV